MKGFISKDSSLQEYYDYLQTKDIEQHPLYEDVKVRYSEELRKWNDSDNVAFFNCRTVMDCEKYITKYCNAYFYSPLHSQEVYEKKENFFWKENCTNAVGCNAYLKEYPKGKYAKLAKKNITIDNIKMILMITISVVVCVAIITILMIFL